MDWVFRFVNALFEKLKVAYTISLDEEPECGTPSLKLVYFDIPGLAQGIRDTLSHGNIPFDDVRLSKEDFQAMKEDLPFGQVPVMRIGDSTRYVAQSKTLLRLSGRLTHTYPTKDIETMAEVDSLLELHSEFMAPISMTLYPSRFGKIGFDKAEQRSWLHKEHIPKYVSYLEKEVSNGSWMLDLDAPSSADFCWVPTIEWLASGIVDDVKLESDVLDAYVARFRAHLNDEEKMQEEPEQRADVSTDVNKED